MALAQAIGRWGNYFNREAYGPVITNPAWQFFPAGVLIGTGDAQLWHVATFFYESMWDLLTFAVLWSLRKRVKARGDVFLWYLALYGSGRYLVEQLRTDSLYLFGLRISQYVGLITAVAVAVVFIVRVFRQHRGLAAYGSLVACVLAFARITLPGDALGIGLIFALYLAAGTLLWLDKGSPRFARIWIAVDAAVYLALLLTGNVALWQSPYFVYAGLSIPPYLAIPYLRHKHTAAAQTQNQPQEA